MALTQNGSTGVEQQTIATAFQRRCGCRNYAKSLADTLVLSAALVQFLAGKIRNRKGI